MFESHCEKCGADKARRVSALNGAPLCDSCYKAQNKVRANFNNRPRTLEEREADRQALRDGLNPYA